MGILIMVLQMVCCLSGQFIINAVLQKSLPMSLIPAEKARAQSTSFDMSQEQVLENISSSIEVSSKLGERTTVVRYLKSAVSQQELDAALATVRTGGYTVEMINGAHDKEAFLIRVSW
jgi:hypothetical protein